MSMYDPGNPQHLDHLHRHKAAWTPEREAALQAQFKAEGKGRYAKAAPCA